MKKLIWIILVLVLAGMTLASCSGTTAKIRVATDATWPPFEYVNDQTKEIEGFDIDLMNAIAEKANLDIEFVNVAWTRCWPAWPRERMMPPSPPSPSRKTVRRTCSSPTPISPPGR